MTHVRGSKYLADLLGVSSNQVWTWNLRRDRNGFPDPIAHVHIPQHPGDKRRAPLWDVQAVIDWWSTYDPFARHGQHWAEKAEA